MMRVPITTIERRLEMSKNKLHEAIEIVLRYHNNQWMSYSDLADEINKQNLYQKKDSSLVESGQISARVNKYIHMFEKDGSMVRLL
jgi:hypothetical protein